MAVLFGQAARARRPVVGSMETVTVGSARKGVAAADDGISARFAVGACGRGSRLRLLKFRPVRVFRRRVVGGRLPLSLGRRFARRFGREFGGRVLRAGGSKRAGAG